MPIGQHGRDDLFRRSFSEGESRSVVGVKRSVTLGNPSSFTRRSEGAADHQCANQTRIAERGMYNPTARERVLARRLMTRHPLDPHRSYTSHTPYMSYVTYSTNAQGQKQTRYRIRHPFRVPQSAIRISF
jgi:hypothetical protein